MVEKPAGYADDAEYLADAMALFALRLRREVAMVRALRRPDRNEAFLGLFLSEADAEAILDELSGRVGVEGGAGHDAAIEGHATAVNARLAATTTPLALTRISRVFGLSAIEAELVLWAAAPAIDDRFGRVYGFLLDDMGRRAFTLGLAQMLLADRGIDLIRLRGLLAPEGSLIEQRLVLRAEIGGPLCAAPLSVDERIVDLLLGRPAPAADLALTAASLVDGEAAALYGAGVLTERAAGAARPVSLDITTGGDPGLFTAGVAARLNLGVRRFDWTRWSSVPAQDFRARLGAALRDARIDGALPLLSGFEAAPPGVAAAVGALVRAPLLLTSAGPSFWRDLGGETLEISLPPPAAAAGIALWAGLVAEIDPDRADRIALDFATTYGLPSDAVPELIADALGSGGDFVSALRATVKQRSARAMAGVAERIEGPFGFDDLVLPAATLGRLRDFAAWQGNVTKVLDQWGLGAAFGSRRGATALFSGPSGTGKTMAASVIANHLGLALFRVDLAGVVSKYIGETEKNLDRVFDAAAQSDVVLFFDEADALFGKRSEVSDARDRYANIEVSYLLQRMEGFDGAAILASNLRQNLDDAFLRRIDMLVDFPTPSAADRARLWDRLEQSGAPLAEGVDLGLVAEKFELTGGEIRNCAIVAAHLAAEEGEAIAMRHLMRAVGREYVKIGQPLRRAIFGEYYGELRVSTVGGGV